MTKILVVDDETSILQSTRLLLRALGFEVATASTPGEVLPVLLAERPDVLLQDVRMPGLDLDALVRSIREDARTRDVPIILFSASMDLFEVQDRVGANGFIEKPFKPREVVQAIQDALRNVTPVVRTQG